MRWVKRLVSGYVDCYRGVDRADWLLIGCTLVETVAMGLVFYLALYLTQMLDYSAAKSASVIAGYGAGTVLGGLLASQWLRLATAKWLMVVALLSNAILLMLLPHVVSYSLNFLLVCALGVGAYGFKSAVSALIVSRDGVSGSRLQSVNVLYVASNLGLGISVTMIGVLAVTQMAMLFFVAGLLLSVLALLVIALLPGSKAIAHSKTERLKKMVDADAVCASLVLLAVFVVGIIIAERRAFYVVYMQQTLPLAVQHCLGMVLALNPLMVVALQAPMASAIAGMDRWRILALGVMLLGLGAWMLNLVNGLTMAALACVIYTVGEMLFFAVASLVYQQVGWGKRDGSGVGWFQMAYAAGVVVGPLLGGALHSVGCIQMVWLMCGLLGVLMSVLLSVRYNPFYRLFAQLLG